MSTKIVVLFNLKPGVEPARYEAWARATDLPTVKALKSIDDFKVFRCAGLLGSEDEPPYKYIEIIDVKDMAVFGGEVASPTMQQVAAEFQELSDNPVFILTELLG